MEHLQDEIKELLDINKDLYAEQIVELQYKEDKTYWEKYGKEGKKLSVRDAAYHLPFLSEALVSDDPKIFTDYVAWVQTLFKGLNLPPDVMKQTLLYTKEVLEKELSTEMAALTTKIINLGISQLQKPVKENASYIDNNEPLGKLASEYNKLLLNGERNKASLLILDAVKRGVSVKDIYLNVFQKSQYEVGRLWLTNQISVAKEHFCSAATQMIMSQLYPYIFSTKRNGFKFLGAAVGGELHELGIRMVADFFEMNGWDTYYLGANAPASSILKAIDENNSDVVGLSASLPYHRSLVKDTVKAIRESQIGKDIKILIGGVAFNNLTDPSEFGANDYAKDAELAVERGMHLVS